MAKAQIKIEKNNDFFLISNDKNYELMLSMSVIFYNRIVELMKNTDGIVLYMNPKFKNLIKNISSKSDFISLSDVELKLLIDWVDCLCLIMLDIDSIDYKDKDIKKYLSLSEKFIKNGKELLTSN